MTAKRVIFTGHVQGVGFRYVVHQLARSFDVTGWVRNLPNGTVELEVAGQAAELVDFIKEIAEESSIAHHIRSHFVETIPVPAGQSGFHILR